MLNEKRLQTGRKREMKAYRDMTENKMALKMMQREGSDKNAHFHQEKEFKVRREEKAQNKVILRNYHDLSIIPYYLHFHSPLPLQSFLVARFSRYCPLFRPLVPLPTLSRLSPRR